MKNKKRKMKCPFCETRPSELPNGSCRRCAMDELLDSLIYGAAKRARVLGISHDKFLDLCDAAMDVSGMTK